MEAVDLHETLVRRHHEGNPFRHPLLRAKTNCGSPTGFGRSGARHGEKAAKTDQAGDSVAYRLYPQNVVHGQECL